MPLKKKKKRVAGKKATTRKKKPVVRRVIKKKAAKPKPAAKKRALKRGPAARKQKEPIVGKVTHYFPHVNAAVIMMKKELSVNDTIKIKGHTTDLTQTITSMQIDHVPVNTAKKGQEIGLLVNSRVRQHDLVYKV
jgi:putative protease